MQAVDNKFEEERLKTVLKDREKQIRVLNQELSVLQDNVRKMRSERENTDKEQLQSRLEGKIIENQNLIRELNNHQERAVEINLDFQDKIRNYETEIRRRTKIITDLNDEVDQLKRGKGREGMDKKAYQ